MESNKGIFLLDAEFSASEEWNAYLNGIFLIFLY